MAKGSRGGRRSGGGTFNIMTDADAQQLRDDVDDMYTADVVDAIKNYISNSNPNGDGFSHAQNLNYKLDNGLPLNATEAFIDNNIQDGMHSLGNNTQLTRGCHDDLLKSMGISDYSKMSESQLKQKLVGTTLQTTSYMSTSYDVSKNPFLSSSSGVSGGREVVLKINAKSTTKGVFGAKSQAEIILNKGTNMNIKNVYYDGTTATPRGRGSMPRVVIEVETY
jgi:hypothetical protein